MHPTRWRIGAGPEVANVFCYEGQYYLLDAWFRGTGASLPVGFEIGLTNAVVTPTLTEATLSGEPQGGAYQRIRLPQNPAPGQPNTAAWVTLVPAGTPPAAPVLGSVPVTFQAGTTAVAPFQYAFLVALLQLGPDPTLLTRILVCGAPTGAETSILAGAQLDIVLSLNLGG